MVSVIIPTLNSKNNLVKLIPTVSEAMKYANMSYEVIINDDPRSEDQIESIANSYPNIKIIVLNTNTLLGKGRLEGAKAAKGEYIMHLDSDMKLQPKIIQECLAQINNNAQAVIIPEQAVGESFWAKAKGLEKEIYQGDDFMESPRFFTKESYFEVGGHDPNLALSEDRDIMLKYRNNNKLILRTETPLLHDESSITPVKSFRNKYYWAQSGFDYLQKHPTDASKQFFSVFFRKAYIKNFWKLLFRPHLTFGIFVLKSFEFTGAILGGFGTKLGITKQKKYKTESETK